MTTDNRLEAVRTRRRRRANDKSGANARTETPRRRGRHRRRRFAGRDDSYVRHPGTAKAVPYAVPYAVPDAVPDAVPCVPGERAVDECIRRGRTNAGPDNRQDVVSKLRV